MNTLFGIPNCNTVKNAKIWLEKNQIAFQFHDFKKLGVSKELLQEWCEKFGWEKVLNRAGLTFKKLDEAEKNQINNQETAIAFMLKNTSSIKRPILKNEHLLLLGFNAEEYQTNLTLM